MREHIPKKCGDPEVPISTTKTFDNTYDRIYGERKNYELSTEARNIGAGKNPALDLPSVGKKTINQEAEIMKDVNELMANKEKQEELERQKRFFQTTMGSSYIPNSL